MARYTIIKDGKAANFAEASASFAASQGWLLSGTEATGDLWDGTTFIKPPIPLLDRVAASKEIDAAVLAIYDKPVSLAREYTKRLKGATDYKAAGYAGVVPPRIAAFATSAGLTATDATDRVILQAAKYETAEDALSDLRMRKFEVQRATTEVDARATHAAVMAAIAVIAAQLG